MDENTIRLLSLFHLYQPEEEIKELLKDVTIYQADVDMKNRSATISIQPEIYIPFRTIKKIEQGISRTYGITHFTLKAIYGPGGIGLFRAEDVGDYLRNEFAPSMSILAGCSYVVDGDAVILKLKGNGKDMLKPHLVKAERWLSEMLGQEMHIQVEVGKDPDAQELFAATEKIRQAALSKTPVPVAAAPKAKVAAPVNENLIFGKAIKGDAIPMNTITMDSGKVVVEGEVFAINHRELTKSNAWVINFDMTDHTSSVRVNRYMDVKRDKPEAILNGISTGMWVKIFGKISYSRFENDIVLEPYSIEIGKKPTRNDTAEEKRVELHLHTQMSSMDALTNTAEVVKLAAKWGHKAIGITDHGVAQAYPDAMKAGKGKIKILYGCEGYFVNDIDAKIAVKGNADHDFHGEYVVFDLETTGLSFEHDAITEIGAAIYKDGKMKQKFQTFVDPKRRLDAKIINLTGITDDMLRGAPEESEAVPAFLEFCGDRPLVAHNADFDVSFVKAAAQRLGIEWNPTYLDTLVMAQGLMPGLNKYKLNVVADALSLPDFNHHRAVDDAMTVGYMLERFFAMLEEKGITRISQINDAMGEMKAGNKIASLQARHIILYAKNNTGLRNLYRLISYGHLKY